MDAALHKTLLILKMLLYMISYPSPSLYGYCIIHPAINPSGILPFFLQTVLFSFQNYRVFGTPRTYRTIFQNTSLQSPVRNIRSSFRLVSPTQNLSVLLLHRLILRGLLVFSLEASHKFFVKSLAEFLRAQINRSQKILPFFSLFFQTSVSFLHKRLQSKD